ncbi:VOC family protein [Pikeienuella sp. HZG-20]|uniref:VOC family protein n=1 Tax=Paludibacillus litoralis TaxID=3133267 RepID=UPI0030EB77C7
MTHPVKGVDHVFVLVDDLDQSRDAYARLGFNLSPRGVHSASKGAANHTIMFPDDYFEILGLIAETPGNLGRRETLAREGQGLHAVACRIDDADAAKAALDALGIATETPTGFSRPVPLPGGGEAMASFRTFQFKPEEVPLGICFMCQHLTRENVWIPELLEHPNSAEGLAAVVAGTEDPDAAARGFSRLFAAGKASAIEGGARVETGRRSAPMEFLTREELAARYPDFDVSATPRNAYAALRIRVSDMARARAALEKGGVAPVETSAGLAVGPEAASGAIIEFVSA